MLIGVDEEKIDDVLDVIRKICKTKKKITAAMPPSTCHTVGGYLPHTIEVTVGGAVVFVTGVDRFEKI